MFDRKIENELLIWKQKERRKPLILRGARQTGKTTLVRKFARRFSSLVELNLEKDAIRKIFSEVKNIGEIIQTIEGITNQRIVPNETLLFLDEIQNSAEAIKLLRYFYEEMPGLHVIGSGSLLEVRMKKEGWSFPVGRVEFLYLYPVTFEEFLEALGENILLRSLKGCGVNTPLPPALHERLFDFLLDYMVVGGMPEAVNEYISSKSFVSIRQYHEALTASFKEDFAKYARGLSIEQLKLVWDRIPFEIGTRIKYSRLAGLEARSAEVSRSFDILHEAMLVERVFPTSRFVFPLVTKPKASPKPIFLDIGLCSYVLNFTRDQIKQKFMDPAYSGALSEQFVGQELLALNSLNRNPLYFWVREEKGASSELDFLVQANGKLIPIEVKSGRQGSLKSLHQFLYRSGTRLGVRFYNGPLTRETQHVLLPDTSSLDYQLLSFPLYAVFRLLEFLGEFQ